MSSTTQLISASQTQAISWTSVTSRQASSYFEASSSTTSLSTSSSFSPTHVPSPSLSLWFTPEPSSAVSLQTPYSTIASGSVHQLDATSRLTSMITASDIHPSEPATSSILDLWSVSQTTSTVPSTTQLISASETQAISWTSVTSRQASSYFEASSSTTSLSTSIENSSFSQHLDSSTHVPSPSLSLWFTPEPSSAVSLHTPYSTIASGSFLDATTSVITASDIHPSEPATSSILVHMSSPDLASTITTQPVQTHTSSHSEGLGIQSSSSLIHITTGSKPSSSIMYESSVTSESATAYTTQGPTTYVPSVFTITPSRLSRASLVLTDSSLVSELHTSYESQPDTSFTGSVEHTSSQTISSLFSRSTKLPTTTIFNTFFNSRSPGISATLTTASISLSHSTTLSIRPTDSVSMSELTLQMTSSDLLPSETSPSTYVHVASTPTVTIEPTASVTIMIEPTASVTIMIEPTASVTIEPTPSSIFNSPSLMPSYKSLLTVESSTSDSSSVQSQEPSADSIHSLFSSEASSTVTISTQRTLVPTPIPSLATLPAPSSVSYMQTGSVWTMAITSSSFPSVDLPSTMFEPTPTRFETEMHSVTLRTTIESSDQPSLSIGPATSTIEHTSLSVTSSMAESGISSAAISSLSTHASSSSVWKTQPTSLQIFPTSLTLHPTREEITSAFRTAIMSTPYQPLTSGSRDGTVLLPGPSTVWTSDVPTPTPSQALKVCVCIALLCNFALQ